MRVLVVSEHPERREALARELQRAGHEVAGATGGDGVMAEIRLTAGGPDIVFIDAGEDERVLRRLIERAREATEDPARPVLVLVPPYSLWLRGALPADLRSVVAVSTSTPAGEAVAIALVAARGEDGTQPAAAELSYDEHRSEASGRGGMVRLTPSESAVLALLIREGRGAVTHDRIAEKLWGSTFADRYGRASIRSHVHTLRRKLDSIGLADAVIAVPGVGYRMLVDAVLPER
jgi:DNA-binding response OmpR family regulator